MLKKIFKRIKSSEFIKNTATLASGTTFAQIISIGTAPIVYRIFEREDYGTLGLYMAVTGVLGVFSTLQYTQTILLAEDDQKAKKALWLNRIINILFACFTLLIVLLFRNGIGQLLNNPAVSIWLFLVPLSLFFSGQNEIFRVWANRKKEYRVLALNTILSALLVPIFSISFGLLYTGPIGLFIGLFASQLIPALILFIRLQRKYSLSEMSYSKTELRAIAAEYIAFPKYSLSSEFINRFTAQLPVFLISRFAGPSMVGVYNLSTRMLGLPMQFVSGSITEVFKQRANDDYIKQGSARGIFKKTAWLLAAISLVVMLFISIAGPDIFAFAFGSKWKLAGEFSTVLALLYGMEFVASPLSYMYYIKGKLGEDFVLHLFILAAVGLSIYIPFFLQYSITEALISYVLVYSFFYFIYIVRSYQFSK